MPSTPSTPEVRPGSGASMLLRIVLSLAGIIALGYWAAISLYLLVLRCGDTCSGDPAAYERWEYVGQFVLAAPMVFIGTVGLVLGFTKRRRTSVRLLAVAAVGAAVWLILLAASGL